MEAIIVDDQQYEEIQGTNDLDNLEDNISKRRKKRKAKRKARRKARKTKRKSKRRARKVQKKVRISARKTKRKAVRSGVKRKKARRTKRKTIATGRKKQVVAKKTARATKARTLGKKKKAKRITHRAKVVQKKGTAGQRVKKTAKKVVRGAALAPLIPLKKTMVTALRANGQKVTMRTPLDKVASLFYNNIVRKQSGFEDRAAIYLENYTSDNIAPLAAGVIEAIIVFIKNIRNKKDKGEKLTKTEKVVDKGVTEAETKLREKAEEEVQKEVGKKVLAAGTDLGEAWKENKTMILIGGGLLVVAAIMAKKSA